MSFRFFILLFSLAIIASCDLSGSEANSNIYKNLSNDCQKLLNEQKSAEKVWNTANSNTLSAEKSLKDAKEEALNNTEEALNNAEETELEAIEKYKITIDKFNNQCLNMQIKV
ncbi:MAG: hypothetical protein OXC37_00120 [Bdellovibrionaceae bacterium]|nr:hypothetical protein [Pseudobdellovibrionaceae bacterium]